jgi:hypothetical protein
VIYRILIGTLHLTSGAARRIGSAIRRDAGEQSKNNGSKFADNPAQRIGEGRA